MSRSTHSDLAAILRAHAGALAKVPAGYCVGDASTLHSLESAAAGLVELDARIGAMTEALALARSALRSWARDELDYSPASRALDAINRALAKPEPARRLSRAFESREELAARIYNEPDRPPRP